MTRHTPNPNATRYPLAALLAERGYTGPEHVIDGKEGLVASPLDWPGAHCAPAVT